VNNPLIQIILSNVILSQGKSEGSLTVSLRLRHGEKKKNAQQRGGDDNGQGVRQVEKRVK